MHLGQCPGFQPYVNLPLSLLQVLEYCDRGSLADLIADHKLAGAAARREVWTLLCLLDVAQASIQAAATMVPKKSGTWAALGRGRQRYACQAAPLQRLPVAHVAAASPTLSSCTTDILSPGVCRASTTCTRAASCTAT